MILHFIQTSVSPIYCVVKQEEESTQRGSCLGKDALWVEGKAFLIYFQGRTAFWLRHIIMQTLKHEQVRKFSSSEHFKLLSKDIYARNSKCLSFNEHSQMYAEGWDQTEWQGDKELLCLKAFIRYNQQWKKSIYFEFLPIVFSWKTI